MVQANTTFERIEAEHTSAEVFIVMQIVGKSYDKTRDEARQSYVRECLDTHEHLEN